MKPLCRRQVGVGVTGSAGTGSHALPPCLVLHGHESNSPGCQSGEGVALEGGARGEGEYLQRQEGVRMPSDTAVLG